jgi:hypothetical protein
LIQILNADGLICLRADISEGGTKAAKLDIRLMAWSEEKEKLRAGEITKEEHDRWRYHYYYPAFDNSVIKAKIPQDIQIAGFGDSLVSEVCDPNLSSVHFYYKTSGEEAAKLLVESIDDSKSVIKKIKMGYKIVVKESLRS